MAVITVYEREEMPPEPQIETVKWKCPDCDGENQDELNFAHGDCISSCDICHTKAIISIDYEVFPCGDFSRKYH